MRISKKRVSNIDKYLTGFDANENIVIIIDDIERLANKLVLIGFDASLPLGEKVLPSVVGSISEYNANGRYEQLRDLPKETFYVSQTRDVKDWHGNYHLVSMDIPYKRYQTHFIEAPSQELSILNDRENNKIIASDKILFTNANKPLIKHTINLFLELFGECNIVDEEFFSRQRTPIRRVAWNILPQGEMPWERLKVPLMELLDKTDVESKEDSLNRFEFINSFSPDFVATGNGGFNDYVVFGFTSKSLYVLENSFAGNATYIFRNDWETLSQLTKAEILQENLQEHRFIHRKNWKRSVREILEYGSINHTKNKCFPTYPLRKPNLIKKYAKK